MHITWFCCNINLYSQHACTWSYDFVTLHWFWGNLCTMVAFSNGTGVWRSYKGSRVDPLPLLHTVCTFRYFCMETQWPKWPKWPKWPILQPVLSVMHQTKRLLSSFPPSVDQANCWADFSLSFNCDYVSLFAACKLCYGNLCTMVAFAKWAGLPGR